MRSSPLANTHKSCLYEKKAFFNGFSYMFLSFLHRQNSSNDDSSLLILQRTSKGSFPSPADSKKKADKFSLPTMK